MIACGYKHLGLFESSDVVINSDCEPDTNQHEIFVVKRQHGVDLYAKSK